MQKNTIWQLEFGGSLIGQYPLETGYGNNSFMI